MDIGAAVAVDSLPTKYEPESGGRAGSPGQVLREWRSRGPLQATRPARHCVPCRRERLDGSAQVCERVSSCTYPAPPPRKLTHSCRMLNYVQGLWCSLNAKDVNRGALVTFGKEVKMRIPLLKWTVPEWFEQVEILRRTSDVCCSCCTPLAEAFREARKILKANPPLPGALRT